MLRHFGLSSSLAVAATLSAVACTPSDATAPVADVRLTRLAAGPSSLYESSGRHTPLRAVVRSEAELRRLWAQLWRPAEHSPPLPIADFSREMLIVVAAGDVGSTAHEILVDAATVQGDMLLVRVRRLRPGPFCGIAMRITQPIDVARVTRTKLHVQFDEVEEEMICPRS